MFWKKKQMVAAGASANQSVPVSAGAAPISAVAEVKEIKAHKLPGPKEMPFLIGKDLVVNLKQNPDWVWSLKVVMRQNPKGKDIFDFRVFNDATASQKGVKVKDYTTLDGHPELILFEGWMDKHSNTTEIEDKTKHT